MRVFRKPLLTGGRGRGIRQQLSLPPDRPAAEPSSEAAASAPQSAVGHDGGHGSNLGYGINLNQVPANTDGCRVAKAGAPYPGLGPHHGLPEKRCSNRDALTMAFNKRFSDGLQHQNS
jgi:hypothetical protein